MNPNGPSGGSGVLIARAEALLRALSGIADARIVAGPHGELREVHVLTDRDLPARQVARNVESALLARLGIAVDHRVITVTRHGPLPGAPRAAPEPPAAAGSSHTNGGAPDAPARASGGIDGGNRPRVSGPLRLHTVEDGEPGVTRLGPADARSAGSVRPIDFGAVPLDPPGKISGNGASQRGPGGDAAAGARPRLHSVEPGRRAPRRVHCRVTLLMGDRLAVSEAEVPDAECAPLEAAAHAALGALKDAWPLVARNLELEAVRPIDVGGRPYVFVSLRGRTGAELFYTAGAAVVEDTTEAAAALSVLQAAAQWADRLEGLQRGPSRA